jgi:ABC-2 type transport system ATP-binding protein
MADVMIQVENLTKDYGPVRAVDRVTFNVRKGEVLGFLGPNGAGKSTTMKMLTCYLAPSGGSAKVAGLDVFDQSLEVRKRIGYLPEDTPIYRDMTVLEFLQFAAEVRGMRDGGEARIKEIGGRCGLADVAGKLIGELSKGYRQRVGLAQAMIHDPEKTVILSTHILSEVEATCSRVIIIGRGKVVADGTLDQLRARERGGRYRVVVAANGVPADDIKTLFRAAVDNRWTLLELVRESASLEDVFRILTAGEENRT